MTNPVPTNASYSPNPEIWRCIYLFPNISLRVKSWHCTNFYRWRNFVPVNAHLYSFFLPGGVFPTLNSSSCPVIKVAIAAGVRHPHSLKKSLLSRMKKHSQYLPDIEINPFLIIFTKYVTYPLQMSTKPVSMCERSTLGFYSDIRKAKGARNEN